MNENLFNVEITVLNSTR